MDISLLSHLSPALIRRGSAVKSKMIRRWADRRIRPMVAGLAADGAFGIGSLDVSDPAHYQLVSGAADRAVALIQPVGEAGLVLKAGWSPPSARCIEIEVARLRAIHGERTLKDWSALVPEVIDSGRVDDVTWMTQSLRPGSSGVAEEVSAAMSIDVACAAIASFHALTSRRTPLDASVMCRLVDEPLAIIEAARPMQAARLATLRTTLRSALDRPTLTLSVVHGDFVRSNILLSADAATVQAVIDWELAQEASLPEIDLAHFVLALGSEVSQMEQGALVEPILAGQGSPMLAWFDIARAHSQNDLDARLALSIGWIHHVAANLGKSEAFAQNQFWLSANVDRALASITENVEVS